MMWSTGRKRLSIFVPTVHRNNNIPPLTVPVCHRIPRLPSLRATVEPHRTVMSSSHWICSPRAFPTSGFKLLDQSIELEEETLPTYQPEEYYPVNQGELFNNRYQTIAKLGYGVTSTVWLAKDLNTSTYIALKVYKTGRAQNFESELGILQHMNSFESKHPGRSFVRKLVDHFYVQGPHGRHICLVHEPLGMNMDDVLKFLPKQKTTLEDMKPCIRQLLGALDYLHSECQIIHTDLQLKNLFLPGPDISYLSRFEEAEARDPSPRKVIKDRIIYQSLSFLPRPGLPLLGDFGEARFGDLEHTDDIMPNAYRVPEVILRSSWGYKVDTWSVGMIAWRLVCPGGLTNGINEDGIFDDRVHMAELIALLGPPSSNFRAQRHLSSAFWDESGNWKEGAPIPDITLEKLAENIEGEDKEGFLRWLRMALQWDPEKRPTVLELLFDRWLMKGLGE